MSFEIKQSQCSRSFILIWLVLDLGSLFGSYYIANLMFEKDFVFSTQHKTFLAILILCWVASFLITKAYATKYFKSTYSILRGLLRCLLAHSLLMLICYSMITADLNNVLILVFYFVFFVAIYLLRITALWVYTYFKNLYRYQRSADV